ncbi:MAG: hypothetical protein AAF707_03510, partial [Pseudomonadota bacterium]
MGVRTALLSALERVDTGEYRAELKLADRTVLAWQAETALKLGCVRVVCLVDNPASPHVEVQRWVEAQGGEFHAVRSAIALAALLHTDDELLVMLDGLMVDRAVLTGLLVQEPEPMRSTLPGLKLARRILTLAPSDPLVEAHPEAFERIDAENCWAGVSVVRAGEVHHLAECPPGGNVVSYLLRLSLQAKTACTRLGERHKAAGKWLLASDAAVLAERERALIALNAQAASWTGPFRALAKRLPQYVPPRYWAYAPTASFAAGLMVLVAGLAFAASAAPVAALVLAGAGAFAAGLSDAFTRLKSAMLADARPNRSTLARSLLIEALLLTIFVSALFHSGASIAELSLPLFAFGLTQ